MLIEKKTPVKLKKNGNCSFKGNVYYLEIIQLEHLLDVATKVWRITMMSKRIYNISYFKAHREDQWCPSKLHFMCLLTFFLPFKTSFGNHCYMPFRVLLLA